MIFQVFQKRKTGALDFYRTWVEYETGFSSLDGDFWLGMRLILFSNFSFNVGMLMLISC